METSSPSSWGDTDILTPEHEHGQTKSSQPFAISPAPEVRHGGPVTIRFVEKHFFKKQTSVEWRKMSLSRFS
jgi:hypothetical protein